MKTIYVLSVVLVVTVSIASLAEDTGTYWQVETGDWSTGENWDNGEPGGSDTACINNGGTAHITQVGEVCDYLSLGNEPGQSGTVQLSGTGQLSAWDEEYIGRGGTGTFTQSGGTNTVNGRLYLGYNPGSEGRYELSDGQLSARRECIGYAYGGINTFTQSGGTNTVDRDLWLGDVSGSQGRYELSGTGELSAYNEYIGRDGAGTFTQSGGTNTVEGDLWLGWLSHSEGRYQLSNTGQLSVYDEHIGRVGTGTFTQTGGTHTVQSCTLGYWSGSSGTYTMSAGTVDVKSLRISYCPYEHPGEGVLNLTGPDADVIIRERLYFGPESTFTAVPRSTIHMIGAAFENENTDPTDLAGLGNLALIFEGGSEDVDPVEVAGEDMGSVLAGLENNFALDTLVLGDEDVGRIMLVDEFDNQPGWDGGEALYVNDLVLNPGATIDLNGLNLYYLNGGDPKTFVYGDANLDGKITIADFLALQNNFGQVGAWADGDFTGDEMVTISDFLILQNNWGFGTASAGSVPTIPEPLTVLLLTAGGLTLIRRCR